LGGEFFTLMAGKNKKGGVDVAVFEACGHKQTCTKDLNKQLVINKMKEIEDKNKFSGLKVGPMLDASTDGNWE